MTVPRFRPGSFYAADFEPQVAQERILKHIIHRVMSIPPPNHIHHIVAHNSRMPKPIQWHGALSLNQSPLVFLIAQFKLVEIIVAGFAIIPPEHIHRTFIEHCGVVRTRWWLVYVALVSGFTNNLPGLLIDVKVKEIIKVGALLSLVAPKKVKTVHVGNASSPRPGQWLLARDWELLPTVGSDVVRIQIIQTFFIIRATKQKNHPICQNALMSCARRKNLPLRHFLAPLKWFQLTKVVLQWNMHNFLLLHYRGLIFSLFVFI